MTTVADLIAHLQTLPQDAIVQCLSEKSRSYETWTEWKNLSLDDLHVADLRGNPFTKPDAPHYGKVFLEIGDK